MIDSAYIRVMARYAAWQNASLTQAADGLDAAARDAERGAFFSSITGTLNHLLWADRIWMSRLTGSEPPRAGSIAESVEETASWDAYRSARAAQDRHIGAWAEAATDTSVVGEIDWWSGAAGRRVVKPRALLIVHMFNHQTHHRGQVHAMLTAAGAHPEPTDLFLMRDEPAGA
ncbi:MAG: DinB family protein [Pseudomonadota bacterium]